MAQQQRLPRVLTDKVQLGPFPMEKLKHVDRPTSVITDQVRRIDRRESVTGMAERGELGPAIKRHSQEMMKDHEPIRDSLRDLIKHLGTIKPGAVAEIKAPISDDPRVLSRHIKRFGYFLKADVMGICHVPETAIYSYDRNGEPIDVEYRTAIVIVTRKDMRTVRASKGADWIADSLSFQAYQHSALIAETMANYIRRLGYGAMPQSVAAGYKVQIPPLLLWAGIGEACRTGIVINPYLGLGYKAAVVLTDMPLELDKPVDFGLQDFCKMCKKCSRLCPSHAISTGDKVMYNGYETWKVNEKRCGSFCMTNKRGFWCNTCVKVCPWTNPDTWDHNLVRWFVMRSKLARYLAIKGDFLVNKDKGIADEKWWFDLVYRDDVLTIPGVDNTDINKEIDAELAAASKVTSVK